MNKIRYSKSYTGLSLKNRLKNFIVKLPFVAEDINEAYVKGGIASFPLASKDIWETMKDEVEKRGKERAKVMLEELLSPISWDSVVSVDAKRGIVLVGGEKIDEGKLNNLQSEAEFFMASDLWKILRETPKALAEKSMFLEGDTIDFLKKGRSMLYTLDSQQKVIDTFRILAKK